MIRAVPFVIELALMIFCLIDAIQAPDHRVRNLPKWAWILLILIVPLAGGIAWLVAGRPTAEVQRGWAPSGYPEYDRPGRAAATNPDDDEAFLRQVRERAEEQRRRYAEQKQAEQKQAEQEKQDPESPQG